MQASKKEPLVYTRPLGRDEMVPVRSIETKLLVNNQAPPPHGCTYTCRVVYYVDHVTFPLDPGASTEDLGCCLYSTLR